MLSEAVCFCLSISHSPPRSHSSSFSASVCLSVFLVSVSLSLSPSLFLFLSLPLPLSPHPPPLSLCPIARPNAPSRGEMVEHVHSAQCSAKKCLKKITYNLIGVQVCTQRMTRCVFSCDSVWDSVCDSVWDSVLSLFTSLTYCIYI